MSSPARLRVGLEASRRQLLLPSELPNAAHARGGPLDEVRAVSDRGCEGARPRFVRQLSPSSVVEVFLAVEGRFLGLIKTLVKGNTGTSAWEGGVGMVGAKVGGVVWWGGLGGGVEGGGEYLFVASLA